MGTHTEYVANRPVTILGRDYGRNDVIDNPQIPVRVLDTLVRTKKIGTRIRHDEETNDGGVQRETVAPESNAGAEGSESETTGGEGGSDGDPDATTPPVPVDAQAGSLLSAAQTGAEAYETQWRAVWLGRPKDDTSTFKAFLVARCRMAGLTIGGGVPDLLQRLADGKVRVE